jgi:putative glutamine amidotransferase
VSRPKVIGITSYGRDGKAVPQFSLPCGYVDAIRAADAVPLILPPGQDSPEVLLDALDALVLAGGGDIDPGHYGGEPHETIYSVSEERDAFEFGLLRHALARPEMPILCICRGIQVLNVVCGGTLHEHIPDEYGEKVPHRLPPRESSRHHVIVKPESRLARILRATEVETCSWHHQAIDRIAPDLEAVAWAEDGVIEGVEHRKHPWCIGVQWHPEMQYGEAPQARLFAALVDAIPEKGA